MDRRVWGIWDIGVPGGCWSVEGMFWGIRGIGDVRGVLGTGRDSRYSGARNGIEGIRAIGRFLGCRGCFGGVRGIRGVGGVRGVLGVERDSRYSGARRGRVYQGHWGLLGGVGDLSGMSGASGV